MVNARRLHHPHRHQKRHCVRTAPPRASARSPINDLSYTATNFAHCNTPTKRLGTPVFALSYDTRLVIALYDSTVSYSYLILKRPPILISSSKGLLSRSRKVSYSYLSHTSLSESTADAEGKLGFFSLTFGFASNSSVRLKPTGGLAQTQLQRPGLRACGRSHPDAWRRLMA
jgi:hypothetical protein